jgi:hypothetical protein
MSAPRVKARRRRILRHDGTGFMLRMCLLAMDDYSSRADMPWSVVYTTSDKDCLPRPKCASERQGAVWQSGYQRE